VAVEKKGGSGSIEQTTRENENDMVGGMELPSKVEALGTCVVEQSKGNADPR